MAEWTGAVTGILVGLTPSAGAWTVELQRSSGLVTSTAWVGIARVSVTDTTSYTDVLPLDNGIRNYRARQTKSGYTAGAWSTRVSARPTDLSAPL